MAERMHLVSKLNTLAPKLKARAATCASAVTAPQPAGFHVPGADGPIEAMVKIAETLASRADITIPEETLQRISMLVMTNVQAQRDRALAEEAARKKAADEAAAAAAALAEAAAREEAEIIAQCRKDEEERQQQLATAATEAAALKAQQFLQAATIPVSANCAAAPHSAEDATSVPNALAVGSAISSDKDEMPLNVVDNFADKKIADAETAKRKERIQARKEQRIIEKKKLEAAQATASAAGANDDDTCDGAAGMVVDTTVQSKNRPAADEGSNPAKLQRLEDKVVEEAFASPLAPQRPPLWSGHRLKQNHLVLVAAPLLVLSGGPVTLEKCYYAVETTIYPDTWTLAEHSLRCQP